MFIIYFLNSWSSIEGVVPRMTIIRCLCNLTTELSKLGLEKQAAFVNFERMIAGDSIENIVYDSSIQPFFDEVIVEIS